MVGRDECTAKRETPSGPAEYDEEEEGMMWDTMSGEMVEKHKIGWEVNGTYSARSKSVASQVDEARDIPTKNEFSSSEEKNLGARMELVWQDPSWQIPSTASPHQLSG